MNGAPGEPGSAPAETMTLAEAPVAAHTVRSGFVESVHRALICVTAPDGDVSASWGPAQAVIFPRSSNKPLQALAMLEAGLDIPDELLALVCSSHSGEPFHLDGVRRILTGDGLDETALQNTPDYPYDDAERRRWMRDGLEPVSIAQNCSGKHAGMLATCVAAGWDVATYREVNHPLQQLMAQVLADFAQDEVDHFGVDGCGAPVMSLSMAGLARAFGKLAQAAPGTNAYRVAQAMRAFPQNVGGTHRDVTKLMQGTPGVVAKDGAEACYAIGLPDGRGVAIKIADGSQRARPVVAAAVLRHLGVESEAYAALEKADILGHGKPVGGVVAALPAPSFSAV